MGRLELFLDTHKNALREAKERLERTQTGFLQLLWVGFARSGNSETATVRMRYNNKFERLEVSFVADDTPLLSHILLVLIYPL